MNEQPTCAGCFMTNHLFDTDRRRPWEWESSNGLTHQEISVCQHLVNAYNEFIKLNDKHPDDDQEFKAAIHAAQKMLALRVARRVDPLLWHIVDKSEEGNNVQS
jgi:hypothetical protein